MSSLILLSLTAFASDKKPLHSGEFRNTAQTTEKGELVLHPLFLSSHYGITDNIDIKVPLLGLIGGPAARVEIGLVDNDSMAFSVEPYASSNWGFNRMSAGASARFTKHLGANRFNASAGGGLALIPVVDEDGEVTGSTLGVSAPINLGFDVGLKDTQAIRFVANTDAGLIAAGLPAAVIGANYNTRVTKTFTLSAGLATYVGPNPLTEVLGDVLGVNLPPVLPAPTFEMWWKI